MTAVTFYRGGLAESEHLVAWAATAPDGSVLEASGPEAAQLSVFARSASKPLQALPALRAGVLERFGLDDRHLALACASHGGAPEHLELIVGMLAACGLSEASLACGPLDPRDPDAAAAMRFRGEPPTRLVHNCSGKHALGLALCQAQGWPTQGYIDEGHPLQAAMRDAVAEATGTGPEEVRHGTDGCGMLAFHVGLGALAAAFGRLASGAFAGADRVAAAMRAHPELVAFHGAPDTELMRAEPGVVAKVGAEGVLAIGLADGRGLALKVLDGADRAVGPAGVLLARAILGLAAADSALEAIGRPAVANSRGEIVGEGLARR